MNQVTQDKIAVAVEDIRNALLTAEDALKTEDSEEAFGLLRAIHGFADKTINAIIVDRLIEKN